MKKNPLSAISWIEEKFLVYSFLFTVLMVFIQVIMRYVFNNSLSWSEELCRYLFICQCWISVSYAEITEKHIRIQVLTSRLGPKSRLAIEYVVILLTVAMAIFLIIYGVKMVLFLITANTSSTALNIPMWIIYTAMPLGCTMYSIRLIRKAIRLATKKEVLA